MCTATQEWYLGHSPMPPLVELNILYHGSPLDDDTILAMGGAAQCNTPDRAGRLTTDSSNQYWRCRAQNDRDGPTPQRRVLVLV